MITEELFKELCDITLQLARHMARIEPGHQKADELIDRLSLMAEAMDERRSLAMVRRDRSARRASRDQRMGLPQPSADLQGELVELKDIIRHG